MEGGDLWMWVGMDSGLSGCFWRGWVFGFSWGNEDGRAEDFLGQREM